MAAKDSSMKDFVYGLIAFVVVFWPWAWGFVDAACFMATGAICTSMPWGDTVRTPMMVLWPVVAFVVVLFFLWIFGQ